MNEIPLHKRQLKRIGLADSPEFRDIVVKVSATGAEEKIEKAIIDTGAIISVLPSRYESKLKLSRKNDKLTFDVVHYNGVPTDVYYVDFSFDRYNIPGLSGVPVMFRDGFDDYALIGISRGLEKWGKISIDWKKKVFSIG